MGKSAEEFFGILKNKSIKRFVDIRLKNEAPIYGFARKKDLPYLLKAICNIDYIHKIEYAPTKELFFRYKVKKYLSWEDYISWYKRILEERDILGNIDYSIFQDAVLLCTEKAGENCHRILLAEYLAEHNKDIEIVNL